MATQVSLNSGAVASAGALALQTNGTTTAITLDTSQNATFAGKVTSAGALTLASNGTTTAATIDTSGNLGIGTTSPTQKLSIGFADASSGFLEFRSATYAKLAQIEGADDNAGGNGHLSFYTRNVGTIAERMRLDSSGKLLLGVTSGTGLSNGDFAMGNGNHIRFRNAANSAYISAFEFTSANGLNIGTGGSLSTITFGISGIGEVGRFDTSGNLLVGTTSAPTGGAVSTWQNSGSSRWSMGPNGGTAFVVFNTSNVGCYVVDGQTGWTGTSDGTLKNVIAPITNGLASISELKPTIYSWKSDEENTPYAGLIAQEVQAVLPSLVNDANGTLGVNYTGVIPYLISAIQEQQALITQLTARITALEGA